LPDSETVRWPPVKHHHPRAADWLICFEVRVGFLGRDVNFTRFQGRIVTQAVFVGDGGICPVHHPNSRQEPKEKKQAKSRSHPTVDYNYSLLELKDYRHRRQGSLAEILACAQDSLTIEKVKSH
jgi:hypothetical protein